MKRYLRAHFILLYAVLTAAFLSPASATNAADAWVYGVKGQYDVYVVTETLNRFNNADFGVKAKVVAADGVTDIFSFKFTKTGDSTDSYICSVNDGNATPVSVKNDVIAYSVFSYCFDRINH